MKVTKDTPVERGDKVKLGTKIYFSEECKIGPGSPGPCLFSVEEFCRNPQLYRGDLIPHWEEGEVLHCINQEGEKSFGRSLWENDVGPLEVKWVDQAYGLRSD
jgi:hypothetical protein